MSFEKYKQYVELLSNINNSCVFLIEYNCRYLYTSPNFSTFFGYDADKLSDPSLEDNYVEKRIHPDDSVVFATIQKKLIDFWNSQPIDERMDYKHIFEFRVLDTNSRYRKVISQHQVLEVDKEGNPHIILGVADLSPDQTESSGPRFRLVNIKTGEIVPFPLMEELNPNLTKRENEILKLINEGMMSKEISEKLCISVHTVNNHRQNILLKMNADNAIETINQARKMGLLS